MARTDRIAIVAVGGNALTPGASQDPVDPAPMIADICRQIADMVEADWRVVITHGSGPQVGFILQQSELAAQEVPPVPMHIATAEVQGAIGFQFQTALDSEFRRRGNKQPAAATIVTRVAVSPSDSAFSAPSKPIGAYMDAGTAQALAARHGWTVHEIPRRGWRRVVASPMPLAILEIAALRQLIASGHVVVAGGGGGIPVRHDGAGDPVGIDAVIDKDHTSALLARELGARLFVNLTGVRGVALEFESGKPRWLDRLTVSEARARLRDGQFPPGSMGPKVAAMIAHLESGGESGVIAGADAFRNAMAGREGTWFYPD